MSKHFFTSRKAGVGIRKIKTGLQDKLKKTKNPANIVNSVKKGIELRDGLKKMG